MDETKITARLPSLDVDIVRREDPEAGAETITIHLRAAPTFDAVGMMLAANALWWTAPVMAWSHAANAAWALWLGGAAPGMAPLQWHPVDGPDPDN